MADFERAFARLMEEEGIQLTNDPVDRGGQTYAGISRRFHPHWPGWSFVDRGEVPPTVVVRGFYRDNFWQPMRGEDILHQRVAEVLFSQFANMGDNGIKLMQTCVGVIADGKVGSKTIGAINRADEDITLMRYALANVARYHAIGMKDKTQRRFWSGWIARALRIVK